MKLEKILTYAVIGYVVYYLFLRKKTPNPIQNAIDTTTTVLEGGDTSAYSISEGGYGFRYSGSSALRSDEYGNPIPCGTNGNPFTSVGIEGKFAKTLSAPTTFFAVLELGSPHAIANGYSEPNSNRGKHALKVGDKIQMQVKGGQFSALENQVATILQLGTDSCTSSGHAEMKYSAIVIDIPIILQGASDYQYPSMEAYGTLTKIN
jgi:hypothetical protein